MNVDVVRAWKDPLYRDGLSPEALAALPANPAGRVEIDAEQLKPVLGAQPITTAITCTEFTFLGWKACCYR